MKIFESNNVKDTIELGAKLGKVLKAGDCVALFGGLGMGKTAFVSGMAAGMGLSAHVSSPTFAIVNVYPGSPMLCHFDMYRVDSWESLYTTGFFEYARDDAVLVTEWSENIENALPEDAVRVTFMPGETECKRIIRMEGEERLEDLGA